MQPRTDDTVPSTTTSESTTPLPTRPVSTISPLSAPLTPRAALQPASTLSPYSCVVPAGFGLAFGSVTGFFVNFAAGDGLGGALRWGVGLATCGAARCLRMKARGGSEYDDPRQNYDRAIGYGIGAATVPLTGEIVDRVTRRATLAPIFVFRRTLMYSLLGVLVGGAMDYFRLDMPSPMADAGRQPQGREIKVLDLGPLEVDRVEPLPPATAIAVAASSDDTRLTKS